MAAAATALLAAALTPTAGAADRPSRATAIDNAAAALVKEAARLGLTSAEGTSVRDVVVDADGGQHVRYDRTYRGLPVLGSIRDPPRPAALSRREPGHLPRPLRPPPGPRSPPPRPPTWPPPRCAPRTSARR